MVLFSNTGSPLYRRHGIALLLLCLLFAISHLQAADKLEVEAVTDLRILVDVSGSMKLNDPHNLRRDALRLLIGMLPKTSRVGIWSFGQFVNMQVKPGFATAQWKKNAYKQANTIHSRGLFTNIEDTLTKSSWDWRRPDPKWDRHIILLTDGMVDISKQPAKNKISRQNILGKILNDLKAANVKIHTIALSAQADHALLKKLAKQSDGWYEAVDSADKLQRLFLRLFEKTTKMDSLPLENNYFDVDESISDMTLLVFRSKSGVATKIIRPDGLVFGESKSPKNIEWYADKNFDIVTVHKPSKGRWKLEADIDKDNRVKIITNLKLRVAALPTNIIKDEAVIIKASLVGKEGRLDDKELLSLVKMTVHSSNQQGLSFEQSIPATETAGEYATTIDSVSEIGDIQVVVRAIAPTFKRELRYEIKVHNNPINLELTATSQGLVITVTEDPAILQTGSLKLSLNIEGKAGSYYIPQAGEHRWQAIIENSFAGKTVSIVASAIRTDNIKFTSKLHGKLPQPIVDPLTIWVEEIEVGLVVKAQLTENVLQAGTLQLVYSSSDNLDELEIIIKRKTENLWQQLLLPEYSGKTLMVSATGLRLSGEKFEKSYQVNIPELAVLVIAEDKEDPVIEESEPDLLEGTATDAVIETDKKDDDLNTPYLVVGMVILVNIFILLAGYFGYRYWKKRDRPLNDDLSEALVISDDVKHADEDKPSAEDAANTAVEMESQVAESSADEGSNEDFSSQRREKPESENVDLDLGEDESVSNTPTDDVVENADIIDTASADDLPDFDVDLESGTDSDEKIAESSSKEGKDQETKDSKEQETKDSKEQENKDG